MKQMLSVQRVTSCSISDRKLGYSALAAGLLVAGALFFSSMASATTPVCTQTDSDPDNDGWGWENSASCIVPGSGVDSPDYAVCVLSASDPDGDGWGWENNQSCKVRSVKVDDPVPYCLTTTSDSDGDGWGWENGKSCLVYQPADITDLILITGQSNTLGAGTSVDLTIDGPDPRVFAYTQNGWQVAELYQVWDRNAYPGTGDPGAPPSFMYNNFALHFGKQLASLDPGRVVGFVLVSEPGEGIENWNPGSNGMVRVQQKVVEAINELPHKVALDGVLWHQGETDWLFEGTSDVDVAQPAPVDYYPTKLAELIANLRNENWYSANEPFICGETIAADGVNMHLNALNTDTDDQTACVAGFGLPATTIGGSHFDGPSLRILGRRYADAYYNLTN